MHVGSCFDRLSTNGEAGATRTDARIWRGLLETVDSSPPFGMTFGYAVARPPNASMWQPAGTLMRDFDAPVLALGLLYQNPQAVLPRG